MTVCDGLTTIGSCAPFANQQDVIRFLQEFCKDCYGEVPIYTDEADFCNDAFGGAADDNCDFLMVKRGPAPIEEYFISNDCTNWYKITFTNNVGFVPSGASPHEFIEVAWGSYADMPDPLYAPLLFIVEGDCKIWIAVNDLVTCDLGTIPATGGTGTGWVEITVFAIESRLKIAGLEVDVTGNTTATIYPGSCRDATNTVDIDNPASINLDASGTGANGLDANDVALAIDTWYYVYLIYGASGVAGFISTSATPTLPVGYTYKRRVGWARTYNPANFYQTIMRDNIVMFSNYKRIATGANIANGSWTALNINTVVPLTTRWVLMSGQVGFTGGAIITISYSRDGVTTHITYFLEAGEVGGCALGLIGVDPGIGNIYVQSATAIAELLYLDVHGYKDDRWDVS